MEQNNAQSIIDAAQQIGKPFALGNVPAVLIPEGMKLETFPDLEKTEPKTPQLLKQAVVLEDADSFIAYYNRFADNASTIFAETETGRFTAIFDYHQNPDAPRHGTHRASYTCPKTKEWGAWFTNSGKAMEQLDFGLFIEQNIDEIVEPSGAAMLEIALSLKSKNNIDFSRAQRLDNGQVQFFYTEQISSSAGASGQMEIPEEIKLGLKPFLASETYEARAKFRYRIKDGNLIMWYDLVRPHKIIESAFADVRTKIQSAMTTGMIINGKLN